MAAMGNAGIATTLAVVLAGCSGTISNGGGAGDAATAATDAPPIDPPDAPPPGTPIQDRLTTTSITVPDGVKAGVRNYRIWGSSSLGVAPVFTVPLANCETLVCYSSAAGARAVRVDGAGALVETINLANGLECRGLAAEPSGAFAALLWDDAADRIHVYRYDAGGNELGTTELTNADNNPTDFGIGDSRLEYGNGRYGAYYHVHSDTGHEGDTLKWITTAGVESTGWGWGCSHSMSTVLRFNAGDNAFMPACVTDCYPGTSGTDFAQNSIGGIYINHSTGRVMNVDAGCNGSVAAELGSAAVAASGWMLSFNAHRAPATLGQSSYNPSTMNQDVAITRVAANHAPGPVIWLTDTAAINEADTSIASWSPDGDDSEQYLVGWAEPGASYVYKLARIDPSGAFLEGPTDVAATWGRRDDPMRRHYDGDIVWASFASAGSTTLEFSRVDSGRAYQCTQ